MSALQVLDGKSFMDTEFEAVQLPDKWMSGSPGGLLHKVPEVQALRKAVPIYYGDFELSVSCLRRKNAPDVSFERFVASYLRWWFHLGGAQIPADAPQRFHFRQKHSAQELASMPEAKQAASYVELLPHRAPIDVLWNAANFGCLLWDWQRRSLEKLGPTPGLSRGVYAPAVDGSTFIPRIFVDVPPELTKAGTGDTRKSALAELEALPQLRNGLSRSAMAKLITEDVRALAAICQKHGTFGAAALPGAFDPITGICVKSQTGNEYETFIATDEHFYFFKVFTS